MTIMPTDIAAAIAVAALALGAIIGCAVVAVLEIVSGIRAQPEDRRNG